MKRCDSIEEFNLFFRQPTLHPHIAVGDISRADNLWSVPTQLDMYCIIYIDLEFGCVERNGEQISTQSGALVAFRPGHTIRVLLNHTAPKAGRILVFKPEVLDRTGLGRDFHMFNFFESDTLNSVSLSPLEQSVILNCFNNLMAELSTDRDYMSDQLLRLNIGQLLSYFKRFYEREFNTIEERGAASMFQRLDMIVENYLSSGLPAVKGYPTVAWCADQFNMTPKYFGAEMHRRLHITPRKYLQSKIVGAAKKMLLETTLSINEISEELGFNYPNHFSRMFRNATGLSPITFRNKTTDSIS